MSLKGTIESRITYRIKRSGEAVFVRSDFDDIGGYDQVGRILRQLVQKELLVSLGYGVYARARKSALTGKPVPERSLPELAKAAMRKLGVRTGASKAEEAYNQGRTTQVPTGRVISVKSRVSRKIGYNGKYVVFEQ